MQSTNEWKTIRSFELPVQAELAQMFLKNHQIESRLLNSKVVGVDYFLSNAVGGVKLQVQYGSYVRAEELLRAADNREFELDSSMVEGVPCPRCESVKTEVFTQQKKYLALIFLTFLSIPLPGLIKEQWRCTDCSHQWEVKQPFQWQRIILLSTFIALVYFLLRDLFR